MVWWNWWLLGSNQIKTYRIRLHSEDLSCLTYFCNCNNDHKLKIYKRIIEFTQIKKWRIEFLTYHIERWLHSKCTKISSYSIHFFRKGGKKSVLEFALLTRNIMLEVNLDKFLLLKESLQVPHLHTWNHNADSQGHETVPCHSGICFFTYFPHLCFPVRISHINCH